MTKTEATIALLKMARMKWEDNSIEKMIKSQLFEKVLEELTILNKLNNRNEKDKHEYEYNPVRYLYLQILILELSHKNYLHEKLNNLSFVQIK